MSYSWLSQMTAAVSQQNAKSLGFHQLNIPRMCIAARIIQMYSFIPSPVRVAQPLRPGATYCIWCGCSGRVTHCIGHASRLSPAVVWASRESELFGGGRPCRRFQRINDLFIPLAWLDGWVTAVVVRSRMTLAAIFGSRMGIPKP